MYVIEKGEVIMFSLAEEKLKEHFGYSSFRSGQKEIIKRVLNNVDTLGIMPTGGGKSICYQIPAVVSAGITLVVTPLISLMKDQVDSLHQAGIQATFLNSTLSVNQFESRIEEIKRLTYKLVYIAPERFEDREFISILHQLPISIVAVDEAHCVSEWGHDFRPSYRKINYYIQQLQPKPVLVCLTATATNQVQNDISSFFNIKEENTIITGFKRSNLSLRVEKGIDKALFVDTYLQQNKQHPGIIYAATRKEVEQLYERLRKKGYAVGKYHRGLGEEERASFQEDFLHDNLLVMIATNAFGMGIDNSNVRYVIHYNLPKNIEAYYQEAGRAGRDGEESECILLFSPQDVQVQKFLIEQSVLDESRKINEYQKLQQMVDYCHTELCLQHYILRYFGDESIEKCEKCSNCLYNGKFIDMTKEAQMVFSCMIRMKQKFGKTLIAQVLTGSKNQKIKQFQFQSLPTYGILREWSVKDVAQFIDYLTAEQFIKPTDGTYPILMLTEKAVAVLKGEEKVVKREQVQRETVQLNDEVFDELRSLRKDIATKESIPPYLVFSDKTLREMSKYIPLSKEELMRINGVGEQKLAKYGTMFLEVLKTFKSKKNSDIPVASKAKHYKQEPSHITTYQLYKKQMSLEEIAKAREITVDTVINHLIKCKADGTNIDLTLFIKDDHKTLIYDAVKKLGSTKLKPIKELLPEEVTYNEIKVALQLIND